MARPLFALTLVGLAVVPDWAAALGRFGFGPPPAPVAVACPAEIVLVPPCLPPFPVLPPAAPVTPAAPAGSADPVAPPAKPKPLAPPRIEPQAGTIPPANVPIPASPRPADPPPTPPVVPVAPTPRPVTPPTVPPASPVPADAPKEPPGGVVVPPLAPVPPGKPKSPLQLPTPPPGTSFSSPLAGGPTVDLYPVSGPAPADGQRAVGFYNHTGRDVTLTVGSVSVRLPKRHFVTAAVAGPVTWRVDDGPDRTAAVPDGAAGLDVVLRP